MVDVNPFEQELARRQARNVPSPVNPFQAELVSRGEAPTEERGFFGSIADAFTGAGQQTRATRELPELGEASGLLAGEDPAQVAALAPVLVTMNDPAEIAQVLTQNFPNIGIQQDEKGNLIAGNNSTGAIAILNRPGMSAQDLFAGGSLTAAMLPSGRVAQGAGALMRGAQVAGQSGATSAAIEAAQAAAGGDFNPENVLLDTAIGGAAEVVPAAARALLPEHLRTGARTAAPVAQNAVPEAEIIENISRGTRRPRAMAEVAESADISPSRLAAAQRLGVAEDLTPGQLSRNPTYIEIESGLASVPNSQLGQQQKQAYQRVAQAADDLILEFGGTTDKTALSDRLADQIGKTISDLGDEAEKAYRAIDDVIPPGSSVNVSNVRQDLLQTGRELGGNQNLSTLERNLLKKLKPNRTSYALLDKERKNIGEALRKSKGPYKDESSATLSRLYNLLTDAQGEAARQFGAEDLWNVAKATVRQRKELEDNSVVLLGRQLSQNIMPKVGSAVKKLSKGDVAKFDEIMGALPKGTQQEVVISALNDAFTGSQRAQQLSVPAFVDWYAGLNKNQAAKSRIMKYLPDGAADRLEDLYKVASGMRRAGQDRIATGRLQTMFADYGGENGLVARLYGLARLGGKAAAAEGVSTTAGVPGAGTAGVIASALNSGKQEELVRAADRMIASPKFQTLVRQYASGSNRAANTEKALRNSSVYRRWVDALGPDARRNLLRSGMQAYFTGSNEDRQ